MVTIYSFENENTKMIIIDALTTQEQSYPPLIPMTIAFVSDEKDCTHAHADVLY